jgi:hypothetical protein
MAHWRDLRLLLSTAFQIHGSSIFLLVPFDAT